MSQTISISLQEVAATAVLAGAAAGVSVQREILNSLEARPVEMCCLDFSKIQCATASFVREAVFGTRDAIRRSGLPTQLIITNADRTVLEEVLLVARALGTSIVHAIGNTPAKLSRPMVLGPLDEAQRETLDLVLKLGEATATELTAENPAVKPTAWNNRLTSLVGRGVLAESRRERHKVYRPVLKGLTYGG